MKTSFFKTKTFIGIICIVLAFIITFLLTPFLNKVTEEKMKVVRVKEDIKEGEIISESDLTIVNITKKDIPKGAIKNISSVAGKIASCNMYKGDFVFASKIYDENYRDDYEKESLEKGKIKISVPVNQIYQSLSFKIQKGDIVTAVIYDKDESKSSILSELTYLYVTNSTSNNGKDFDEEEFNGKVSTITFLLTKEQAKILVEKIEKNTVYFALVYRGNDDVAREYINVQDKMLY